MAYNALCGITFWGSGTYTTEGITKICEALKGSAVTSLKCAASPERLPLCQRPLTLLHCCTVVFTASRLGGNCICGYYDDDDEFVANTEGLIALCEGLKGSAVTSLECAATPQVFAFLSAPIDTPPFLGSLANNLFCGLEGDGTYTAEGITTLCEALKGSAVTSLKCAAAPRACLCVSAR